MNRLLILCLCFLLVGCTSVDLTGTWYDPNGETEITFEENIVYFLGIQGTYTIDGDVLVMTLEDQELSFKFEIKNELLILFYNDSKITLERKS